MFGIHISRLVPSEDRGALKFNAVDEHVVSNSKRRARAERRFRMYGIFAIAIAIAALAILLTSITSRGFGAITQSKIQLEILFDEAVIDPKGDREWPLSRPIRFATREAPARCEIL